MAGSAIGEGVGAISQGIKVNKGFNTQTDFLDLPLGDRMWSYNLDRWMRATFYLNHPRGTPYPPTPLTTPIADSIAPGLSLAVSNSGPLIDLLSQP